MALLIVGLTCILSLFILWPFDKKSSLKKQIQAMDQKTALESHHGSQEVNSILVKLMRLGHYVVNGLGLQPTLGWTKKTTTLIQQAGMKKVVDERDVWALKLGLASGLLVYVSILSLSLSGLAVWASWAMVPLGFFWPQMWLKEKAAKREAEIRKEMPYVLNSIAIMTDAGLDLFQAIGETAGSKTGALTDEFTLTLSEIQAGFSRGEALIRMADRANVTELTLFLSSLTQSLEKGSEGISALLKKQADELWRSRKNKAKELAEKASMKLFMPMLLLVMPALLIFLLTPAGFVLVEFIM